MQLRQILIIAILTVFLPAFTSGQNLEEQLKNYLLHLQKSKVDTFLILKSGCADCEVKYSDTSKAVSDGQTVYILSQQLGGFTIVTFDDFGRQHVYTMDTCSLFDTIMYHKAVLRQKDVFYDKQREELKKGKFLPPRPIHYSYYDLAVRISKFTYEFKIVENDSGMFIFPERQENWFVVTKDIIFKFFSILKAAHD